MLKEKIINPEQAEKEILKIIITRHGPKLSAEGEKNAKAEYFDEHVKEGFKLMSIKEDEEGLIHVNTSGVSRAHDTAKIITEELSGTKHRTKKEIIKKSLNAPYQPLGETENARYAEDLKTIIEMQAEIKQETREEIERELPDLDGKTKEAELRNRIDIRVMTEIFSDETKDDVDRKFNVSYNETADNFAKRYFGFLRHIDLLEKMKIEGRQPKREPYIQIDVSHSFQITAFLKKYLIFDDGKEAEGMGAEDFFKKTGGTIRESGSFDMDYVVGNDGELKILVKGSFTEGQSFRGQIDMRALKKLKI